MNELLDTKHELLLERAGDEGTARLVMSILATAKRIDALCTRLLAEYHLSESRLAALLAATAEPGMTPRQLAQRLDVTSATVTGLLDRLERDDLIERRPHQTDRRTHTLHVTVKGENLISTLVPVYARWFHGLTHGLTTEQCSTSMQTLISLRQNLGGAVTHE